MNNNCNISKGKVVSVLYGSRTAVKNAAINLSTGDKKKFARQIKEGRVKVISQ